MKEERNLEKETSEIAHSMMPKSVYSFDLPNEVADKLKGLPQLKESPSSIVKFLGCPLSWVANRYVSFPILEGQVIEEGNPWAVLGDTVHRILELFYNEYKEDRSEDLLDDLYRACMSELENMGVSGLVESKSQEAYFWLINNYSTGPRYWPKNFPTWLRKETKMMIKRVYEIEDPQDIDIISTEKWLRKVVNGVLIRGKLDREIQSAGGQLVIDDWKTGKNPPIKDDEEIEVTSTHFLPSGIYGRLDYSKTHGEVNRVRVIHLKTGDTFVIKMTNRRKKIVDKVLDLTTKGMNYVKETGEVSATPGRDNQSGPCQYCPISHICAVFAEDTKDPWGAFRERAQIGEFTVVDEESEED